MIEGKRNKLLSISTRKFTKFRDLNFTVSLSQQTLTKVQVKC